MLLPAAMNCSIAVNKNVGTVCCTRVHASSRVLAIATSSFIREKKVRDGKGDLLCVQAINKSLHEIGVP